MTGGKRVPTIVVGCLYITMHHRPTTMGGDLSETATGGAGITDGPGRTTPEWNGRRYGQVIDAEVSSFAPATGAWCIWTAH